MLSWLKIFVFKFKLLLLFAFIYCFPSTVFASSGNKIIHSASEYEYPPFCVSDSQGNASGFSVELLRAVLKAVGQDVDFYVGPWHQVKKALQDGEIDVLPMVGKTKAREEFFDFTATYMTLTGSIFVRKGDTRINNIGDLKNKQVLVMQSDSSDEYATQNDVSPFIIRVAKTEEAMKLLSEGKYDAVVAQHLMGVSLLEKLKIYNVVPIMPPIEDFSQNFCFAVNKGNTKLLARLDEGLSIVIANGKFYELYNKWFANVTIYDYRILLKQVIKKILYFLIPLMFLIFFVSLFLLRRQVRKKTEDLWIANLEWQNTFDAVPDMIAIIDREGKILKVNDSMAYKLQETPKKLIGKKCCTLFHGKDYSKAICPHQEATADGMPHSMEIYEEKLGGYLLITVIPLKNIRDELAAFVHVARDITEQKKAEDSFERTVEAKTIEVRRKTEDLLEAKRKYRIVADFTSDWEYWLLPDKTFAYISPSCEKITGYTMQEFLDNPKLIDLIIDAVDKRIWVEHSKRRLLDNGKQAIRFRINRKDGQKRWIEHICQAVFEKGEFLGYRISNRDVTDNHDASKERNDLREQIAHITRLHSMGELTAALAHEINQPLGAILSNAQAGSRFLSSENPDMEEVRDALFDIVSDAKRAGEVVRRLRRMVRSEKPDYESVNISVLIEEVLSLLASEIVFNHVAVKTNFKTENGNIFCDRVQIQQVLLNLIKNAIESMKDIDRNSKLLQIKTKYLDKNKINISISDSGCGVDAVAFESLFDPFKTTKKDGMGIGLAISRRIIESHKGKIWGEINKKGGMTFEISIPVKGDYVNEE